MQEDVENAAILREEMRQLREEMLLNRKELTGARRLDLENQKQMKKMRQELENLNMLLEVRENYSVGS